MDRLPGADLFAVVKGDIGREAGGGGLMPGVDRGAGCGAEGGGGAEVVVMRVAEQDGGDWRAGGFQHGGDVGGVIGSGVQHCDAAGGVDEIGVGAPVGHDAGVVGDHATDAGDDGQRGAAGRFGLGQEAHVGVPATATPARRTRSRWRL